jgi:chromosome partitioning protein
VKRPARYHPVVAVLNPKGGTGKTTLATNLARALGIRLGIPALLLDTDPQGTARDWQRAQSSPLEEGSEGRQVESVRTLPYPEVRGVDVPGHVRREAEAAAARAVVVIDGAAKAEAMAAEAAKVADLVLIPVQPSPADIWGASDLVRIVRAARTPAAFVVVRQVAGTRLAEDIGPALGGYGLPVFAARTAQRVAYAEALLLGRTVLDLDRAGAAAAEVLAVADEVLTVLGVAPEANTGP